MKDTFSSATLEQGTSYLKFFRGQLAHLLYELITFLVIITSCCPSILLLGHGIVVNVSGV